MIPRREVAERVLRGVVPLGGEDLEALVEEGAQHARGAVVAGRRPLHRPH